MKFETVVNSIEALPPLNDAIQKIQNLYTQSKEDLDIVKLVELIESDALLAANILKIANSPIYGFSRKISSVSQAVTLFGIMQIYALTISHAIEESIHAHTEVYGVSKERFNSVCQIQSALIIKWYSKIHFKEAQLLSSIALIMESGKLILANEIGHSSYEDEFKAGLQRCSDIALYEKEILGATSYSLSALLFKHWNLDPFYAKVLGSLDSDKELSLDMKKYVDVISVIKRAVNMKELLTKNSVVEASKLLKEMGLEVEPFVKEAIIIKKSYITHMQHPSET